VNPRFQFSKGVALSTAKAGSENFMSKTRGSPEVLANDMSSTSAREARANLSGITPSRVYRCPPMTPRANCKVFTLTVWRNRNQNTLTVFAINAADS